MFFFSATKQLLNQKYSIQVLNRVSIEHSCYGLNLVLVQHFSNWFNIINYIFFCHVFITIIWNNGNKIETNSKNIKSRINLNHNYIDTCRLGAGEIQELLLKTFSSRNDMDASCILTNPDNPAKLSIGDIDNPLH